MAESADADCRPAVRADVIAALRQHGVPGVTAAELWRLGQDLRRRTRRRGQEHAVTLELESGQPIGPLLTGSPTSTDLSPHLRALRPGRRYVVLHTHPRSTSFSDLDIRVLAEQEFIGVMVVVGADGAWYVLSRQFDRTLAHSRAVEIDFLRARVEFEATYGPNPGNHHRAVERATGRHGWRYDRVQGNDDE